MHLELFALQNILVLCEKVFYLIFVHMKLDNFIQLYAITTYEKWLKILPRIVM